MFGALLLGVLALGACSGDEEDGEDGPTGVLEVGGEVVGACLEVGDDVGDEISELPIVECEHSHTHEIYAVVRSEADVYPGFETLEAEARLACLEAFEPYVGSNPFDSELFYSWLVPTLTSWDRDDDREIICVAGNTNDAPLVGTIEDSQR